MDEKKDFFSGMNGKTVFVFGLVVGIAVMSIFGNGISLPNLSQNGGSANVATVPTAAAPTADDTAAAADDAAQNVPAVTDADHVLGDANAPITWIEYSDFECPYCQRFHPTTQQMMQDYAGQVKLVFRHFPLSFHEPVASKAAVAAECAAAQGGDKAFWDFADVYFPRTLANGQGLSTGTLTDIAKEIGLNTKKFDDCLTSGKYDSVIQADIAGGSGAGVTGTPGSIVIDANGQAYSIPGAIPYEQVQSILDQLTAGL